MLWRSCSGKPPAICSRQRRSVAATATLPADTFALSRPCTLWRRSQGCGVEPCLQPGGALQPARRGPLLGQVNRSWGAAAGARRAFPAAWPAPHRPTRLASWLSPLGCSMNVRGKEDMADVLDVVEWAAEQLPGPDKQVAVVG